MYAESNLLDRIVRKARKTVLRRLLADRPDYRKTTFLAGVGRSGTTWVANIINHANSYRLMFEPFNNKAVDILRHFKYRQYLRSDNDDPRYLEPAERILSGQVRDAWIDSTNRKFIARKRLIKDIRANHLLKWIKAHFPEIPIVLLLRHPCAVAYSKLKLDWDTDLQVFLAQEELMEDYLNPFRAAIESASSDFDKHIFHWCIENYVPLKQFAAGEFHLAFYEHFCANPNHEIQRLFSFLGEHQDENTLSAARVPSSLCRKDSAILTGDDLTNTWTTHLRDDQIQSALEILTLFGLHTIYLDQPMPLISGQDNPLFVYPKT